MKRKLLTVLGLLLVVLLSLVACAPAGAPASAGETAGEGEEAAAPAEGEQVTVRAMLESTAREFDTAAVEYCAEETGITIEVVNGPESATDRLAQYLQF